MSATILTFKESSTLPIEAEIIAPDRFIGLSQAEVEVLPLLKGRRQVTIGDLFDVQGDGSDEIVIRGDLSHVKRLGEGMTQGRLVVEGNVGMHLGVKMCGGEIEVHGNTANWAGAHMRGGTITIHGDAGSMLGGAYTGERRGMSGGVIIVHGNVGIRTGERMRRGLIVVLGDANQFTGTRMIAGSILVLGTLGPRAGANMKRGTLVTWGGLTDGLLPTFCYACTYQPTFLRYMLQRLQSWGLPFPGDLVDASYCRYTGDLNTIGKGEILVYDKH